MNAFRSDPIQYLDQLSREYGDIIHIPTFRAPIVFLRKPEHFRQVLIDNREGYARGRRLAAFKPVFGEGLLLADGEAWKSQRRLVQPLMSRKVIKAALPIFKSRTKEMIDRIGCRKGDIDIGAELDDLSLSIAIETMFQGTSSRDTSSFRTAIEYLNTAMTADVAAIRLPRWVPTASNRKFNRSVAKILSFIEEIISQRHESGEWHDDLLSVLMDAADDRGNVMSDSLLRDQVATLLLTGFETTALALTWTIYLLSTRADVYRQLQEEADRVESPVDENELPYAMAIIKEAMRLYPPAWAVTRTATSEDEISGFDIPKGATIILSIFHLQRDARYWDEPIQFDPERFLSETETPDLKDKNLPFSTGPRRCLGEQYANMQTATVLWLIAKSLDLSSIGKDVEKRGLLTLRPTSPVLCRLRPRT